MSSSSTPVPVEYRSSSSNLSDSLGRQLFIRNVIEHREKEKRSSVPAIAPRHLLPPQEEESILRRSLKDISADIKKMEDFITITEDIIRREHERDRDFYSRERKRKFDIQLRNMGHRSPDGRSIRAQVKQPTYKINASKFNRKIMNYSPRADKPRTPMEKAMATDSIAIDEISSNLDEAHAIIEYIRSESEVSDQRTSYASDVTGILSRTSSASFDLDENDIDNSSLLFDFDCSNLSDEKIVIEDAPSMETDDGIEMTKLRSNDDIVGVELNTFDDKEADTIECSSDVAVDELSYQDESLGPVNAVSAEEQEERSKLEASTTSIQSNTR